MKLVMFVSLSADMTDFLITGPAKVALIVAYAGVSGQHTLVYTN